MTFKKVEAKGEAEKASCLGTSKKSKAIKKKNRKQPIANGGKSPATDKLVQSTT